VPAIAGFRYVALVAMTYLTSAALYSRIPEPYCGPGCNMALARPLIAFVLPTAIAVVVGLLGLLWRRDPIRDRDTHMDATYHAIIATVVFLILGVHLAVLFALTSQLQMNVVRFVAHAVPVMLGLALIIIGNLLPRLRPNIVIGIRTSRTLSDRGAWARTNRTAGYAAVGAGTSFLLAGMLPNLPVMEFATFAAAGVMAMLAWSSWRSRHA
jgi:immunity protein, SdpI family